MSLATTSRKTLVLVKHAQPVLDPSVPPREWTLGEEGQAQARELATRLRPFLPCALISSTECKAQLTAAIVGAELGVIDEAVAGLEEIDRPAMPIVSPSEHESLNARLFEQRDHPVVGCESASAALARFTDAVDRVLREIPAELNVVLIAHGTVIALYVEQQTGRSALDTWRRLGCAEFVTLPA